MTEQLDPDPPQAPVAEFHVHPQVPQALSRSSHVTAVPWQRLSLQ